MEKSNKGSKGIIVILVLLVLGLGGYIAYDKLYAKEDKNVKTKEKNETPTTLEDKELTSDERYAQYLKNIEKALDEHFKITPDVSDDELSKLDENEYYNFGTIHGRTSEDVMDEEVKYAISLSGKSLYLSIDDIDNYESHKVAENVLRFFEVEVGNAGYSNLYYITTEGKLYSLNHIQNIIDNNWNFKKYEIKYAKNIVNVVQGNAGLLSGYAMPILIDIDGNMYTDNGTSLKKLN